MLDDRLDDMRSEIAQLADKPFPWHFSSWSYGVRYALQVYAGPAWMLERLLYGRTVPSPPDPVPMETMAAHCTRLLHIGAQLDDMAERIGADDARSAVIDACRTRLQATLDERLELGHRTLDRWRRVTRWSFLFGMVAVMLPQLVAIGFDLSNRPGVGLSLTIGSFATVLLAARLTRSVAWRARTS